MNETKLDIAEKNQELLILYSQANLKEEKLQLENDLIELNDKFIYFKCHKFKTVKLSEDDKHAIGMFGMLKAIRTFDISKGVKFITYAARIIDNEILMELRRGKRHLGVASLEETVFSGADGSELRIEDAVSDTNVNIERDFIRQTEIAEIKEMASAILNPAELYVFEEMIVNDNPSTQWQVSEKLNLSQSYISRIKKTVNRKLIDRIKRNEEEEDMSKMTKSIYKKWKEKGYKDKEIAEKMGVTISSLYSFKFENGLTKKHNRKKRNNVSQVKEKDSISAVDNKEHQTLDAALLKAEATIKYAESFANRNGNIIEEAPKVEIGEIAMTNSEEEHSKQQSEHEGIIVKENKEEDKEMLINKEEETNKTEMELALLKIEAYEENEFKMKKELESVKVKLELTEQINALLMKQHLASIA